ncbi:MAG: hypothetical protein DRN15_01185 [Thermoprotei archaeon]|nr:MAG: hypothetical protein DRN15_01185 [Thermoprotei archaeon]
MDDAIELLRNKQVIPVSVLEAWKSFEGLNIDGISNERLWLLANLVETLINILADTKASRMNIAIDIDLGRYALAIYDEDGRLVYCDFISDTFPERLLRDVGVDSDTIRALRDAWHVRRAESLSIKHSLLLQPLNPVDIESLKLVAKIIHEKFNNIVVVIGNPLDLPSDAYDKRRRQYRADIILQWLRSRKQGWSFVLGVTDADIFIPGFNFVFSAHNKPVHADIGLLSLARLRQRFYGLKEDHALFLERVKKQTLHIIGHFLGLPDCANRYCVMSYANSIVDVDTKTSDFCPLCQGRLVPGRIAFMSIRQGTR